MCSQCLSIYRLTNVRREHLSVSRDFDPSSNLSLQLQNFQHATRTFILMVVVLNSTLLPTLIAIPVITYYNIAFHPYFLR